MSDPFAGMELVILTDEAVVEWDQEPRNLAELEARLDVLIGAIGRIERERSRNVEVVNARSEQLSAWLIDTNEALGRQVDYLTRKIEDMTRAYDFGRKRSRRLPAGSFGYRKTSERLEITDRQLALLFARQHGLRLKLTESVDPSALREHMEQTGEIPEGTTHHAATDRFYVKPDGLVEIQPYRGNDA